MNAERSTPKRHHATAKVWEWLEKGDGRERSAEDRARIAVEIEEMDDELFRVDRARRDPTTKIGASREFVPPENVAEAGPHEFVRLSRWRYRSKCRHCFFTPREHPIIGWVPARPYGDKR